MEDFFTFIERFWPLLGAPILGAIGWFATQYSTGKIRKESNKIESRKDIDKRETALMDRVEAQNKELLLKIEALEDQLSAIREQAHFKEIELTQIKILLSALTGVKEEDITVSVIMGVFNEHKLLHESKAEILDVMSRFVETYPHLLWVKKRVGPSDYEMIQVSEPYAVLYLGKPASFYGGKKDSEVWGEKISRFFVKNDEKAFKTGRPVTVEEPVDSPLTGIKGTFKGVKWSFSLKGETYICGTGIHVYPEGEKK